MRADTPEARVRDERYLHLTLWEKGRSLVVMECLGMWDWGWRVVAFVVTWLVAGLVFGTVTGRAGSAWQEGDEK